MLSGAYGLVTIIDKNLIDFTVGHVTFAVSVPNATQFEPQVLQNIILYTHWNQENGPTLFGFAHMMEKTMFTLILSCAGIGPKMALSILDQLGVQAFIEAVQTGNNKALSNVYGIGSKKAEQLIFNIKGKISKLLEAGNIIPKTAKSSDWHTVHQALESLNYSTAEISHAMGQLQEQFAGKSAHFDQLMRAALSALSKQK